jgi:hypothetical protein
VNFANLIGRYLSLMERVMDFSIVYRNERVIKVERSYMSVEELHLGCGLVVQLIQHVKNKGKFKQILVFEPSDFNVVLDSYLMSTQNGN